MTKILIADDEPKIRNGLKALVLDLGPEFFLVAEAADGEEALSAAQSCSPDILLVDINMPFMNGLDFIARLQEARATEIRIIVISGYDDFEYARRSVSLGVFAYILKPVDAKELTECILRARAELELSRRDGAYLSWAQAQMEKEMDSLVSRFFREWCEGLLSAGEIDEYRNFLGLELPSELGMTVAMTAIPEPGDRGTEYLRGFAEHLVARRALTDLVRTIAGPFNPLTYFTDDDGRIAVITRTCSGEDWSDLCAEIVSQSSAAAGRPVRVAQSRFELTVSGPHDVWDSMIDELAEGDDLGMLSESARAYVETNYMRSDLSLEHLADELKVTPGYASRLLKRSTGFGFSNFLNRVRVARAISIINDPQVRLGEVAELVGYKSHHYFCRAFKKVVGISPGEFRDGRSGR